jgi:hypothetical protein
LASASGIQYLLAVAQMHLQEAGRSRSPSGPAIATAMPGLRGL